MSAPLDKPLDAYPPADLARVPTPPSEPPQTRADEDHAPAPEVAVLSFLDPEALRKTVPLQYPFELNGQAVREIVVRRLTVAEVGRVFSQTAKPDIYDFYAAMTGCAAPVLRGLIDEDGDAVLAACAPFLPRIVKDALSLPMRGNGGDIP